LSTDFEFRKVGECLYRYSSNGVYYARFKTDGKEIRRSLETTDRAEARRKLAAEKEKERQTDRSQGKLTLRELCDRWLKRSKIRNRKRLNKRAMSQPKSKRIGRAAALFKSARLSPVIAIYGWRVARANRETAFVHPHAMLTSKC
jgi:hypothetical protein